MGVTIRSSNNIPRLKSALEKLDKKTIQVGVFGEDGEDDGINLVDLARVHEYGTTITPKNSKYLTVPINKKAKNKRAADFPNSFVLKTDSGEKYIVQNKGKTGIEFLFWLTKSVTIPERSFLRTGFDENVDKIINKMERMLNDVIEFKVSPSHFTDMIGKEFAGLIQKKMKNVGPPNHKATTLTKGSSRPLMDTGRLVGSIRHKVE